MAGNPAWGSGRKKHSGRQRSQRIAIAHCMRRTQHTPCYGDSLSQPLDLKHNRNRHQPDAQNPPARTRFISETRIDKIQHKDGSYNTKDSLSNPFPVGTGA